MKVTLTLTKKGETLCREVRDIGDAETFAAACADIWNDLEQRALERATSVGEFMDRANEVVFDQLDGALLSFERE
ncbi:MAG: hypothetical protein ACXWVK_06885 [Rhodoplanes sp.]